MDHPPPDLHPTVRRKISAEVEVPYGRVHVEADYFPGHLDESYDWMVVGIENATRAVLAQLNEQLRH